MALTSQQEEVNTVGSFPRNVSSSVQLHQARHWRNVFREVRTDMTYVEGPRAHTSVLLTLNPSP